MGFQSFLSVKRKFFQVDVHNVSTVSLPDFLAISELSQRAAELEVRLDICESERRHARTTLESVPAPLIITTPFDEVAVISDVAAKLFGVSREDAMGQPVDVLMSGSDLREIVRHTRELHVRGERRICRRVLLTTRGARMFDITLLCVCDDRDGNPSPWGVVVLLSSQPDNVGEDAATGLLAIRGYAELLASEAGEDADLRRRYAEAIATETSRLLAGITIH